MSLSDNIIHCDATVGDGAPPGQLMCPNTMGGYGPGERATARHRAVSYGWTHVPPDGDYCVACVRRRRLAAAGACSRKRRAEKQAKEETP